MTAGRTVNSQSLNWCTPIHYIEAVKKVFCVKTIDLDPCSNEFSLVNAKTEFKLPESDGLLEDWDYRTIYVNPPYGSDRVRKTTIKNWLKKCHDAHYQYQSEIIALIPVATNTLHWKKYVWVSASAVAFLSDTRLKFLVDGKGGGKGAPMACAMVYWGEDKDRFFKIFSDYGAVVNIDTNKSYQSSTKEIRKTLFDYDRLTLTI